MIRLLAAIRLGWSWLKAENALMRWGDRHEDDEPPQYVQGLKLIVGIDGYEAAAHKNNSAGFDPSAGPYPLIGGRAGIGKGATPFEALDDLVRKLDAL